MTFCLLLSSYCSLSCSLNSDTLYFTLLFFWNSYLTVSMLSAIFYFLPYSFNRRIVTLFFLSISSIYFILRYSMALSTSLSFLCLLVSSICSLRASLRFFVIERNSEIFYRFSSMSYSSNWGKEALSRFTSYCCYATRFVNLLNFNYSLSLDVRTY